VPKKPPLVLPDHRPPERCAIPHIKLDARQRSMTVSDRDHVGHVKHSNATCGDPIADSRRAKRVNDRKCLNDKLPELEWLTRRDDPLVAHRVALERPPAHPAREYRTVGAAHETSGMIKMRVGQEDRLGRKRGQPTPPVLAAVDHHPSTPATDEHGAVSPVQPTARADIAPRPDEQEPHANISARSKIPALIRIKARRSALGPICQAAS